MNPEDTHFPEASLENLVATLTEEVRKIRETRPAIPRHDPAFDGFLNQKSFERIEKLIERTTAKAQAEHEEPLSGFLDQESFRRFEEMLKNAVAVINAPPQHSRARLIHNSWPELRSSQLATLELVTNFFEVYRSLAYRVSEMSRPELRDCHLLMIELITSLFEAYRTLAYRFSDLQNEFSELRRMVVDAQLRQDEKIELLSAKLGGLGQP